jgi:hypothetical protein
MKKHDERSVLAQLKLQWQAEIDYGRKIVKLPQDSKLSIHICGKLDYLQHYCGWIIVSYLKRKKNVDKDN